MDTPRSDNPTNSLVAGCWYAAMIRGTEFRFWMPHPLTRREAKFMARAYAGPEIYAPSDIESVRRVGPLTTPKPLR